MARPTSIVRIGSEQAKAPQPINMVLYGHPGSGKTPIIGTGEATLILDSDNGIQSAETFGSKADFDTVIDYGKLDEIYEYLRHDKHPYRWVWWDSLTLFQERVLIDEIMQDAHAENPRQSPDVPSQREYLINMNRISRYVRQFVALPINFGFTAHVMITEDHDGTTTYMPYIQGKGMPSKVCGYMNVIGYLGSTNKEVNGKKKEVPRVLTKKFGKFYARDRFNALGTFIDNPTIPEIESRIREAEKKRAATRTNTKE